MEVKTIKRKFSEIDKLFFLLNKIDTSINDKLSYAVKKVSENIGSAIKSATADLDEKIYDIRIDHAAVDKETGVLLTDEKGNFKFTPEKLKALNKALKPLNQKKNETLISFEPFIAKAKDNPRINKLDIYLVEELKGILFE